MFESTSDILRQCGIFAAVGFFLGIGYDILRFFRILLKKGNIAVNIEDVLYLPLCAFVIFVCVVEYGTGELRIYYLLAALFGAAAYLFTLGRITRYAAGFLRRVVLFIAELVKKPLHRCYRLIQQFFHKIFSTICQKIDDAVKNARFYLKKRLEMVYNRNNSKMGKLFVKGGEERHVIRAEIRKKA